MHVAVALIGIRRKKETRWGPPYSLARVAVTKYHWLGGLKNRNVFSQFILLVLSALRIRYSWSLPHPRITFFTWLPRGPHSRFSSCLTAHSFWVSSASPLLSSAPFIFHSCNPSSCPRLPIRYVQPSPLSQTYTCKHLLSFFFYVAVSRGHLWLSTAKPKLLIFFLEIFQSELISNPLYAVQTIVLPESSFARACIKLFTRVLWVVKVL